MNDQTGGGRDADGPRADDAGPNVDDEGRSPEPVDPGDPSVENVAFVVLGALLTLFVLGRVAGIV